jgi:predicted P-loop ATPase
MAKIRAGRRADKSLFHTSSNSPEKARFAVIIPLFTDGPPARDKRYSAQFPLVDDRPNVVPLFNRDGLFTLAELGRLPPAVQFRSKKKGSIFPIKDAASEYLERGWNLMRLPPRSKNPYKGKGQSFAKNIIDWENIDTLTDHNLAVLFTTAGELKDLDCDYQSAADLAEAVRLSDGAAFGRKSVGIGHYLFNASGCEAKRFELPRGKYPRDLPVHNGEPSRLVVELRGNDNTYTMFPPSVHPSGETVAWKGSQRVPTATTAAELRVLAGRHAFASVVLYFYPEDAPARYDVRMALTGALVKAGMPADQVTDYVQAVAKLTGDPKWKEDFAERTEQRLKDEKETTGLTKLIEVLQLPDACLNTFHEWLDDGEPREVKQINAATRATNALEWRERNKYGMPVPSLHNARKAITDLGVTCSYDTFHSRMLFGFASDNARHILSDSSDVDDNAIVKLRQLLSDTFGFDMGEKHTREGVISLALDHCFDPICDMLDKAQGDWDGVKRLDRMAVDYFNCTDTPLNRAVIRVMMIAAVRRARHPGCKYDTIVVLESDEGWNKSTAFRILAGDDDFSDESILGKQSREVQEHLAEVWIHENADLAGMKKAESETVKAFASRISDNARPAYGHVLKKQKRHSIEVGTTNSSEYLPSQTGNRRFWPLKVLKTIDLNKLMHDRLQLWGEAATLEAEGASIVLDEKLWGAAGEQQEARRVKDNWEEIVRDMPTHVVMPSEYGSREIEFLWLKEGDETGNAIQIIHREGDYEIVIAADVLRLVLGVSIDRQTTAHSMRLSTVMQVAGWGRGSSEGKFSVNGKRVRGYCRPTSKLEKGRLGPKPKARLPQYE